MIRVCRYYTASAPAFREEVVVSSWRRQVLDLVHYTGAEDHTREPGPLLASASGLWTVALWSLEEERTEALICPLVMSDL